MKYLKILILLNLILFLNSCGTLKKGFSNQKKTGSDEFLVEKKSPLQMPPNYNELPIPEINNTNEDLSENKIKSMLIKSEDLDNNTQAVSQNLEETLIKKIQKN